MTGWKNFHRKAWGAKVASWQKDMILRLFDILDNCAQDNLRDISKTICSFLGKATLVLEQLETVGNNNLSKSELENLKEIRERLYRIYSIITELYVGYFKVNKKDKWEFNFVFNNVVEN